MPWAVAALRHRAADEKQVFQYSPEKLEINIQFVIYSPEITLFASLQHRNLGAVFLGGGRLRLIFWFIPGEKT